MPLRSDWSGQSCPIARSLDVVGDPWVLLILREAMTGSRRFETFRDRLDIADNVLSRRLQALVESGLLRRESYRGEQRTHQEYLLTEAGVDLLPVLNGLALWGEKHTTPPSKDVHLRIVHTACGRTTKTADLCSHCGVALTAETTAWRRSWLSPQLVHLQGADG